MTLLRVIFDVAQHLLTIKTQIVDNFACSIGWADDG